MNYIRRIFQGLRRQWIIIDAVAAYDRDRQASGSSLGAWENLMNPLQMMLFFLVSSINGSLKSLEDSSSG